MNEKDFLKELSGLWTASTKAYHDYLMLGKRFRESKQLKYYNEKVITLLETHRYVLNREFDDDIDLLLAHYYAWTVKWVALKDSTDPGDDVEFVFANAVTFPTDAANRLEQRLNEL